MLEKFNIPEDVRSLLEEAKSHSFYSSSDELYDLSIGNEDIKEVKYDIKNEEVTEAVVFRVRNGLSVNYTDPYLRRRDPDCMYIGDDNSTDKNRFDDHFDFSFNSIRDESFEWLKQQDLALFSFKAGKHILNKDVLVIGPANAGFFMFGLSLLQGITDIKKVEEKIDIVGVVYVAPVFRYTHFNDRQIVVHNRMKNLYEIFAFNLYPGPSAKKGVYGMMIDTGEKEDWIVPHCSAAQVCSPYDNITTFMHEGASGGGKSEMLQVLQREEDGRILLGENVVNGEKRFVPIPQACKIMPVADDMAMCHPSFQKNNGKITILDGENAWFVRVNHIEHYNTDNILERITIHPPEKLLFLNIDATPNSTALIWEHTYDSEGVPCPNPRVIIPRRIIPNAVEKPVAVDVRSFGVRTPPCTRERPTYGILGFVHVLPPALAWLWRLVSPRGHGNPSIVDEEIMGSEGVGSYWPFATGNEIKQANLLFDQIERSFKTLFLLIPNQYVGAWKCGFVPQWIIREYLTRRGNAKLSKSQFQNARSSLLGYELNSLTIEGVEIYDLLLKTYMQPEIEEDGYDAGAKILKSFFERELAHFDQAGLNPKAKKIIECFFDDGSVEDYRSLL
jgi:hypothetical protein